MCSHEEISTGFEECEVPPSPQKRSNEGKKNKTEDAVEFLPKAVEETRSTGTVKLSLYWKYFRAGANHFVLFSLILMNLLTQVLYTGSDYWLNVWFVILMNFSFREIEIYVGIYIPNYCCMYRTRAEENRIVPLNETQAMTTNDSGTFYNETLDGAEELVDEVEEDRNYHVVVYSIIVGVFSIVSLVRTLLFFKVCMDASVNLHSAMFQGIIRAPMRFFEVNPVGEYRGSAKHD
jgi:ATP-binding cassette subfamily C (CFTR/MRP) protein 4